MMAAYNRLFKVATATASEGGAKHPLCTNRIYTKAPFTERGFGG